MSGPITDELNSTIHATKKLKSPKPKRPKYVTADNCKLDIVSDNDKTYYLAWYIIDDADFGSSLGEYTREKHDNDTEKDTGKDVDGSTSDDHVRFRWEALTASEVARSFSTGLVSTRYGEAYSFPSAKAARTALDAVNLSLSTGSAPWPGWAVKARAEGWTPPPGWTP